MAYRTSSNSHNDDLLSKLKSLDAFPKQREEAAEFFQSTVSGGVITIVAGFIMTLLFFSELGVYLRVRTVNELYVDTSRGEQMKIHFNITFPAMGCSWISVDAMDVSGEIHLEVEHEVFKQRLGPTGRDLVQHDPVRHEVGPADHPMPAKADAEPAAAGQEGEAAKEAAGEVVTACGSCYGAEDIDRKCCATCNDVREAYRTRGWALNDVESVEQCKGQGHAEEVKAQQGEGCRLWGDMSINKVAGNLHFAPGKSYQQGAMHIHDLSPFVGLTFDLSHTVHKLSFGTEYPGMRNPLDGGHVRQQARKGSVGQDGAPPGGIYQYFLKVVPTTYTTLGNSTISSNQYAVTEHFKDQQPGMGQQLPGVFFFYDLSPIKVSYKEERRSFLTFVTSACAIVGGVFTVSGILDATVWAGQRAAKKKRELGKLI